MHHFTRLGIFNLSFRTFELTLPCDQNLPPFYWLVKVSRFQQRAIGTCRGAPVKLEVNPCLEKRLPKTQKKT